MRRGRQFNVADAINAFAKVYGLTKGVMQDAALAKINDAQQQQSENVTAPTADQVQAAQAYDQNIAQQDAQTFGGDASQYNTQPIGNTVDNGPQYSFLGQTQATPFTPQQMSAARLQAMSGVLAGTDPLKAMQLQAAGLTVQNAQNSADERSSLASLFAGAPDAQGGSASGAPAASLPQSSATQTPSPLPSAGAASSDTSSVPTSATQISAASTATPSAAPIGAGNPSGTGVQQAGAASPAQPTAPQAGSTATAGAASGRAPDLDAYLTKIAPQATLLMLKHGDLAGAQAFQKWTDSEQGSQYASAWLTGVRKLSLGDNKGAIQDFQTLYNQQLYSDGKTVKLVPSADGSQYTVQQYDANGTLLGSQTMNTADLAKNAALALEPTTAVKAMAEGQAKAAAEASALQKLMVLQDRQDQRAAAQQAANLNMQNLREDRADARQTNQLNAIMQRQQNGGGITLAQQSHNAEIDAARQALSGMSVADVRAKTQPYTATGRENPVYDPQLAAQWKLATQRKIGADPAFDSFNAPKPQPTAPAYNRADVVSRFRADGAMNRYRLGADTPQGAQVLDKTGKLVGYYR